MKKRISIFTKLIIYFSFVIIIYSFMSLIYDFSNYNSEVNTLVNLKDEKEYYIDYFKDKYNIEILYGNEYNNLAKIYDGVIENNEENIMNFLRIFKDSLDKYPTNFFNHKKVSVILVNKFNNNNIALATRNMLDEYKIYMSFNDNIERSFHHEMYHVFEYVYDIKFDNFNKYNPTTFNYLSSFVNLNSSEYFNYFDSKYVCNYEKNNSDIYFVTKYSKYSEKEDRAEIFAEIMTINKYPIYLNKSIYTPLKDKVNSVIDILNEKVDKNGVCYWNRFNL